MTNYIIFLNSSLYDVMTKVMINENYRFRGCKTEKRGILFEAVYCHSLNPEIGKLKDITEFFYTNS